MNLRNNGDDLEHEEEVGNLICLCFEHFSFWLSFTLLRIQDNFDAHAPTRISSINRYKEKRTQIRWLAVCARRRRHTTVKYVQPYIIRRSLFVQGLRARIVG